MSTEPRDLGERDGGEPAVRRLVPEGVIRGIEDIAEGRTASAEDLADARKY